MSEPKSLLLDFSSWKRALNPATRVVGYTAAIYVALYIIVLLPLWLLKVSGDVYSLGGAVVSFGVIFGFLLSIFKVIDETSTRKNPLELL